MASNNQRIIVNNPIDSLTLISITNLDDLSEVKEIENFAVSKKLKIKKKILKKILKMTKNNKKYS